jgi:hypothetical protein
LARPDLAGHPGAVSILFFGGNGKIIKPQFALDFADTAGLLIRVPETRSAFRRRDVRPQSRSFARENQRLQHSPNSNRRC